MTKKKRKKSKRLKWGSVLIAIFTPITIILIFFIISGYMIIQNEEWKGKAADWLEQAGAPVELSIPEEYLSIYQTAGKEYGVPWTLLAAHHRVETRFSTMETMVSPVGAEGHMQFMPCTFVGWSHPTCEGLGEGDIPKEEMTDPVVIDRHGGYGIDANGDGIADPWDIEDAVFSAANYLSKNGATDGEIRRAVYNYNHSEEYVEDVMHYYHQYENELQASTE